MKNAVLVLLTSLALTTTIGCGEGGGKLPSPTSPSSPAPATDPNPPPPPAPQGPFNQTLTGIVPASDEAFQQFVAPRDGIATLKLRWADASADLDFVLTGGSCSALYRVDADCQHLGASRRITGTEETISTALTAGQAYRLWVDNYAPSAQAYTIEIGMQ